MSTIIINEATGEIMLKLPSWDYKGVAKAEELVEAGKADSVLVCEVRYRVKKRVEISVDREVNPEIVDEDVPDAVLPPPPWPAPPSPPAVDTDDDIPI